MARPFPSFPKPLFQSKAKYKARDMIMSLYSDEDETYHHKKDFLLASFWKLRFLELGSGLQSVFTNVASIYANLLELKKAFA